MEYDFSSLPEVVWVEVMSYLGFRDRYSLSLTCHTLHSVFSHPSLWKSAKIFLLGGTNNFGPCKTFMLKTSFKTIERFGTLFRDLTITISGHVKGVDSDSRSLLEHLAEHCCLESLTLEAGQMVSSFHIGGTKPNEQDLLAIVSLINKASRLKKISVISWPMYPDIFGKPELNIFHAMMLNEKLKNLESLSLFWTKRDWSELNPLLPSLEYTLRLVTNFKQLTHLAVRAVMLDSDIMRELAECGRAKMKLLQVFVSSRPLVSSPTQRQRLSFRDWVHLVLACPQLQVEVVIMSPIRDEDLADILNPRTPLTSVTFLKHSGCNDQLLTSLANSYENTLKQFVCHCMMTDIDESLLYLVTRCHQMEELVVTQALKHETVAIIQDLRRWNKLNLTKQ
ncbi:uncharacterized protein LOC121375843 [Gigantopelta aegis]|uniref:uncharacterized protein LOC121375843 n=1 Tax=Gigantopelta aegis TaxID=1735272 RepID=UPI001B88D4EC|nr:uncharacterized protein LOC121375843 [Gigantopelta aegis]